jgi:Flp pilus assembly protein TadG
MRIAKRRRRDRGQALVEVALVAPLFFLIFFGIIDIARVIWANDVITNAAREGARFASVNAGSIPGITVEATPDEIREHALQFVVAGGLDPTVTVCVSAVNVADETPGCTGDVSEEGAEFERGNLVTVRVQSRVPVFTGALAGHGDFVVTAESTVLINN